jgi:hypothetical protein
VEPFTQKNHDDLLVCISAVRDSLLLVFQKNRQLFLELLASMAGPGVNPVQVFGTLRDLHCASFCVFEPALDSPAHGVISLAMA